MYKELVEENQRLKEENKRLLEALPKTQDGVPITPGMKLFTCYWAEVKEDIVDSFTVNVKQPSIWCDGVADEEWLFADPDKAEAARREK